MILNLFSGIYIFIIRNNDFNYFSFSCKQININGCVRRGLRPLHYAVFENDLECVRLLIEDYNADVNVLDEAGYSPLHLAAKYGFIDIMHILIDHGSLINFHIAANNV